MKLKLLKQLKKQINQKKAGNHSGLFFYQLVIFQPDNSDFPW